jgi:hypothetical protein
LGMMGKGFTNFGLGGLTGIRGKKLISIGAK